MRRPVLLAFLLVVVLVSATVGVASAITPADSACRSTVKKPYSNNEIVTYLACREDRQDAQLTRIEAKLTQPTATVTVTAPPKAAPTVTVTATAPVPTSLPTVGPSSTSPTPSGPPTQTAATPTGTVTPSSAASAGEAGALLFEDDFSGAAGSPYDHSKWGEWSVATYNPSAAYGEIKPGDRAVLDGAGHLSIPASPSAGTSISTKDHVRFLYGTVTARMRVQTQTGYWPAFWMLNTESNGSSATGRVGETDVLEAFTKYDDGYRSAAHHYVDGVDNGPHRNTLCGGGDVRGSWHDYSARIEPGKTTFLFDGKPCWSYSSADFGGKPFALGPDNPAGNWLLLTNAVGNSSQGMERPTQDSSLLVDRVEIRAI